MHKGANPVWRNAPNWNARKRQPVMALDECRPMIDDLPVSEILTEDELVAITGYKRPAKQCAWLDQNGWVYYKNRAGHPIVGRIYVRQKLAGIKPDKELREKKVWSLDLSKVS